MTPNRIVLMGNDWSRDAAGYVTIELYFNRDMDDFEPSWQALRLLAAIHHGRAGLVSRRSGASAFVRSRPPAMPSRNSNNHSASRSSPAERAWLASLGRQGCDSCPHVNQGIVNARRHEGRSLATRQESKQGAPANRRKYHRSAGNLGANTHAPLPNSLIPGSTFSLFEGLPDKRSGGMGLDAKSYIPEFRSASGCRFGRRKKSREKTEWMGRYSRHRTQPLA